MKYQKKYRKAFGLNEFGIIDLPNKYSNVRISRIIHGDRMGCSYCFPHGIETINSKYNSPNRNWKTHRLTQYR